MSASRLVRTRGPGSDRFQHLVIYSYEYSVQYRVSSLVGDATWSYEGEVDASCGACQNIPSTVCMYSVPVLSVVTRSLGHSEHPLAMRLNSWPRKASWCESDGIRVKFQRAPITKETEQL